MMQIIWISLKNSLSALNEAFGPRKKNFFHSFPLKIQNIAEVSLI